MNEPLFEYLLQPKDISSPHFAASTHKASCRVLARDEREAREMAAMAFRIAVKRELGKPLPYSPWKQEDLVAIEVLGECDPGGPCDLGVIDPPYSNHAVSLVHRDAVRSQFT